MLSSDDGSQTVNAQYWDHARRISSSYSDGIILDTVTLIGSILIELGSTCTTSTAANLMLLANDQHRQFVQCAARPCSSSATSPLSQSSLFCTMNWSGADNLSGVASYAFEYGEGSVSTWTPWLSETTHHASISGPAGLVTLARGECYCFRVRARGSAGNLEIDPEGDGDISTFKQKFMIYFPLADIDY